MRVTEYRGVKALFIAKVVVYGRDVGPSPPADVADGGVAEALLRKDFARSLQKPLACVGTIFLLMCHALPPRVQLSFQTIV
jgi:hypothetical protein